MKLVKFQRDERAESIKRNLVENNWRQTDSSAPTHKTDSGVSLQVRHLCKQARGFSASKSDLLIHNKAERP